jgi:hypothetical protein
MISVRVCEQNRIKLWQLIQCDSRLTHTWQKSAQCRIKVRVGEDGMVTDLN